MSIITSQSFNTKQRSLLYTLCLICVLISSGGIFFIRSDWPFGFDGAYLAITGILSLFSITLLKIFHKGSILRLGLCSSSFLLWVYFSINSILIAGIINESTSASIFLCQEMGFVLLLFGVGFSIVRYLNISIQTTLLISSIFVLVAIVAFVEQLLVADSVRRIKALASVNYMASSFAAFLVYSAGSLLYFRKMSRLTRNYLFLVLIFSFVGVFFSASRSAYLSLFFVFFCWIVRFCTITFVSLKLNKSVLKIIVAVIVLASILLVSFFRIFQDIDLTGLVNRFEVHSIIASAESRITKNFLGSIPSTLSDLLIGKPDAYGLIYRYVQGSGEWPHNLFISTLRFCGIISLLFLLSFYLSVFVTFFRITSSNININEKKKTIIMVSMFFVFSVYAMSSGHFTRNWHLYWIAGLLSGHFESLKIRRKRILNIDLH